MKTKFVFLVLLQIGLSAFSQDRVGHVTLLKKNITAIRVAAGTSCPEGFKLRNGECVPITTVTTAKTEGAGHVTLLKKNITAIRVTPGTDCPEGFELKNGECVPITTVTPTAEKLGNGHVTLLKKNESGTPLISKVKRTGHVTLLRFTQVYLGGGIFLPSATTKDGGGVNGIDINLNLYQPIWIWGGKTEGTGTSLGINVGGSYTIGNGDYALDNRYTVYHLQGESAPPTVVTNSNENTVNQGFKFEGGPQLNIHLGGITVSPIFNVGYLNMTQKSFAVSETLYLNTVEYPYDLLTQKEAKTTGLAMIPKLRLTYNITPRIGIWAEGNYILGPNTEIESTRFVLDPTIPSDSYNLGHFQEGQYITTKTKVKYSGLGVNAGIVIGLGKGAEKPITNETVMTETPKSSKGIEKEVSNTDTFSWRIEKNQEEQKNNNCISIQNPKNGSNLNVNETVKVNIRIDKNKAQGEPTITIYKISNDKNYWSKKENINQLLNPNDRVQLTKSFETEAKETGFKPLTLMAKQSGSQLESSIDKGKLSEGAYKLIANTDCGVSTSNFTVSSGALTTVSLTTNCKPKFGDYSYTLIVKNTGANPINATSLPIFTSSSGTISGFSVTPPVPLVIPAGGTQSFTGSFSYTGSYTGDVYATVSGHQVGNVNLTSQDTEVGELKACICDYCEKSVEFDYNTASTPTFSATNNSIHISQDLWDMAGKPLVGVKAEIIGFERMVGDECMKCDKNSNQWGNFIGGNSGSTVGTFSSVNDGGITGNTYHSIYFYPSNSYKYDLDIAIPPLSSLSCCCDKIKVKIRYTHIFKEANGECKMCSTVIEYEYSHGTCITQPSTPTDGPFGPWHNGIPIKVKNIRQTNNN